MAPTASGPATAPTRPSIMSSRIVAALEGFVALLLLQIASGFATSTAKDYHARAMIGPIRLIVAFLAFVLLFGSRFAPGRGLAHAATHVARSMGSALFQSPGRFALALVGAHAAQAAVLAALTRDVTLSGIATCADMDGLVWAPAFEEFVYRIAVFYVVLQRAGGNYVYSGIATATLFSFVHVGNAWAQHGVTIATLQMLAAAVAGIAYTAVFVQSGTWAACLLPHVANNAVAYVWQAHSLAATGSCSPIVDATLALSLAFTACTYALAAIFASRAVMQDIDRDVSVFRKRHALVYANAPQAQELPDSASSLVQPPRAAQT